MIYKSKFTTNKNLQYSSNFSEVTKKNINKIKERKYKKCINQNFWEREREKDNNLIESYTKSRYALRYDKDGMAQGSGFNNLKSALDFVHSNNINNFSIHKNPFNQTADEKDMLVFGLGDNYWMAQAYKKLLIGDVSLSKKADLKSTPLKFYYYTDFKNGYKQVKFTLKDFLNLM